MAKTVDVTLRFKTDKSSADAAKRAAAGVGEAARREADKASASVENLTKKMQRLGESAERMQNIGATLAGIGASITGPLLMAAQSYAQTAGRAEAQSRRWLVAQERIAKAGQDVGRVVVQQALPYLEKAADLAEKAARFAEQHPEVIDAALKIGTVVTGLGAALMTAGTIAKTIANVGMLYGQIAPALTGGALAKAAPALGMGGSVLGGLGLGFAGHEALAKTELGQSLGMKEGTAGKALSLVAYGLGSLVGKGDEAFKAVAEWTGQLEKTTDVANQATSAMGATSLQDLVGPATWKAAVDSYQQFEKANTEASQQYEKQRLSLTEQYGKQRADAEKNYEKQRADIIEDFARSQARVLRDFNRSQEQEADSFTKDQVKASADFARSQAQADEAYYKSRAEASRQYGVEVQRAEEDHQRQMKRMQDDYLSQVSDAEIDRDATALLQAMRSYNKQRQQTEEDYQVETRRRNEDYAQSISDQDAAYQEQRDQRLKDFRLQQQEAQEQYDEQRAQRLADFEQQRKDAEEDQAQRLADMDADYQERRAQMETQQQQDLADLQTQYNSENALRQTAFNEQLTALDAALTGQQTTAQAAYAQMEADFQKYLDTLKSQVRAVPASAAAKDTSKGSNNKYKKNWDARATGGYAPYGDYTLGEGGREFVLNAPTTQRLEGALGSLSQSKLASLGGVNFTIAPTFSGVSSGDQGWIRQELAQLAGQINAVPQRIAEVLGGN